MRRALWLLRYVPQSLFVAALVAATLVFQPWVLIDPIDRFTYFNGPSRSMIPDVFASGESIAAATGRLTRSGYAHSAIDPATGEGYTDLFRKPNVAFNVACGLDYVVWIKRVGESVEAARSDVYSICL